MEIHGNTEYILQWGMKQGIVKNERPVKETKDFLSNLNRTRNKFINFKRNFIHELLLTYIWGEYQWLSAQLWKF